MSKYAKGDREKSKAVDTVAVAKYSGDKAHHDELVHLVNDAGVTEHAPTEVIAGANRVTVIVSTPEGWGGSFSEHPGHCGIALWKNDTREYQSCGICTDGKGVGYFESEEVNAKNNIIKADPKFKIWYFTADCKPAVYTKLQARMSELHKKSQNKSVGYAKILAYRGGDSSFSCVTAVDTILAAGGWSYGLAAQTSTPWAYAQTFTSAGWYISHAAGHKHM